MSELKAGLSLETRTVVTESMTAKAMRSGELEVLATPIMIALMEAASSDCVKPLLEEGFATVGTKVDIEHISATPAGLAVTVKATLVAVEGRRLEFEVEAHDEVSLIGKGTHQRFIVNSQRFSEKALAKRS